MIANNFLCEVFSDLNLKKSSCQGRPTYVRIIPLMELQCITGTTIKISSKKGIILIDPDTTPEAAIAIMTQEEGSYETTNETLIIEGAGEYEAKGIVVKGIRVGQTPSYEIDTEDGKLLFALSSSLEKLTDEDEFDGVLIKVVDALDEGKLAAVTSGLIILYGDEANIPDGLKEHRVSKVNLKKKEELPGNILFLEKK